MNQIQQKDSYLSSFAGWFKNLKDSFLFLLRSIKLCYPFKVIKCQITDLLIRVLIYPVSRVILGKRSTLRICAFFWRTVCPSKALSLPPPFKSKIKMMGWEDFGLYSEIYLANIYSQEVLNRGMSVIDIGAHIGTYTILVAEKIGKEGKVIAIEPEPKNYEQLLKNIQLNHFENVIPQNIALADYDGFKKLYLSSWSGSHSLVIRGDEGASIEVPVKTLDKLVEELNLKRVDIIKIDAEGAEISILKGAEKTLKANPNIKIIVATEHYPSETEEVCQFLNERGLKTKILREDIVITI